MSEEVDFLRHRIKALEDKNRDLTNELEQVKQILINQGTLPANLNTDEKRESI